MRIDHLAIAAETLEDGVAWAEEKFGLPFLPGGKHDRYGTHNRLLGLAGNIYLEVIAVDPMGTSDGPRWFGLDDFRGPPRLANWICEPSELAPMLRHGMERVSMQRGDLTWDMGVPADGSLPMGGAFPTVLDWTSDTPPGVTIPSTGITLEQLTVRHPKAHQIADELDGLLTDERVRFREDDEISLSATFVNRNRQIKL